MVIQCLIDVLSLLFHIEKLRDLKSECLLLHLLSVSDPELTEGHETNGHQCTAKVAQICVRCRHLTSVMARVYLPQSIEW